MSMKPGITRRVALTVAVAGMLCVVARGQPPRLAGLLQKAKLSASNGAGIDRLGESVAVRGDIAVVGAPGHNGGEGAVYVFRRPAQGWESAVELAVLTASDGQPNLGVGFSVSMDGDTIVAGTVGVISYTGGGGRRYTGAVYLYEKPSTGWASATETAKLTASDGALGDQFGYAVTIRGDTVAAGANAASVGGNLQQGAVYVFEKPTTGWTSATETQKLLASNGTAFAYFGEAVSSTDDVIAVGAGAYVFERRGGSWTEIARLTTSSGAQLNAFGASITALDDVIAVGAPLDTVGLNTNQGSVYVYEKPISGWASATETARLTASDGAAGDLLGVSLTGRPKAITAAAPSANVGGNTSQGAAYVFEHPASGWTNANETLKILASDGASGDHFGQSVAMDEDTLVVGANGVDPGGQPLRGAAYVFRDAALQPGTGCGTLGLSATGSTWIGDTLDVATEPCAPGSRSALLIGTPLATPVSLSPAIACGGASPCLVSCNAIAAIPVASARLLIPNTPAAVGVGFCVQGACVDIAPCVRVTDRVDIRISR